MLFRWRVWVDPRQDLKKKYLSKGRWTCRFNGVERIPCGDDPALLGGELPRQVNGQGGNVLRCNQRLRVRDESAPLCWRSLACLWFDLEGDGICQFNLPTTSHVSRNGFPSFHRDMWKKLVRCTIVQWPYDHAPLMMMMLMLMLPMSFLKKNLHINIIKQQIYYLVPLFPLTFTQLPEFYFFSLSKQINAPDIIYFNFSRK